MRKTATLVAAAVITVWTLAASAQADNFFVGLLTGANWQPPKCTSPEVLTQLKDRHGNILFRCIKPTAK